MTTLITIMIVLVSYGFIRVTEKYLLKNENKND